MGMDKKEKRLVAMRIGISDSFPFLFHTEPDVLIYDLVLSLSQPNKKGCAVYFLYWEARSLGG